MRYAKGFFIAAVLLMCAGSLLTNAAEEIWSVKAISPEGRTLDIKAYDKDGAHYDIKAIEVDGNT